MLNRADADYDLADIYILGSVYCRPNIYSNNGFEGNISSENGIVTFTYNGRTTHYVGNSGKVSNGRLLIDGIAIQSNDPRCLENQNRPQRNQAENKGSSQSILNRLEQKAQNAPAAPADEKDLTPRQSFLNKCSPFTKQYIESFMNKKTHSEIINEMKLSQEEMALLDNCCDPVSMEVMNIPVKLHGNIYDFDTVLDLYAKNKQDIARNNFGPENIAPSRKTKEQFEEIIKNIISNRKAAEKNNADNNKMSDDHIIIAPGGPNFPGAPGGPSF